MTSEVYLLPLNDNGEPNVPDNFIYLPPPSNPPYSLRFEIEGTSSICRQGTLWVNIPENGKPFERESFRAFKLESDFHRTLKVDVPVPLAGAFAYYVTYSPLPAFSQREANGTELTQTPLYYIDVAPKLEVNGTLLPVQALSIFSVISKFLGAYPKDWEQHLRGIGQRNYNMVHFTPLMQRGGSNSPYALLDQLKFDPECFPGGESDVAHLISTMEERYGLLGMTDVVWNHTAYNSTWLEDHPEAGYNLETAPWLEPAFELDSALLKYSNNLTALGLPTDLETTDDLARVMEGVKMHVIGAIKLWEFYVIDVEAAAEAAVETWRAMKSPPEVLHYEGKRSDAVRSWSLKEQADFLLGHNFTGKSGMGARFHRRPDPTASSILLWGLLGAPDAAHGESSTPSSAHSAISRILDEVNLQFYREYDADTTEILEQVSNRVKYVRLDDHGPKSGPITREDPLIESYFTRLPRNATTQKHNQRSLALVNNGWVWAADAMRDNAGPDSKAYLRREIIVWSDCVKLRYGNAPRDNPYLWERMTQYTQLMAKYFVAFRIDNCHSTPIAVAEYLLGKARDIRPNLAVFAELFTGSEETDYAFVKRLGLSALIREAMQAWSTGELSRLVHRHGGRPIGSFDVDEITRDEDETNTGRGGDSTSSERQVKKIKKSPLHALFMDCTHDNELPAQKRDARDTLPNAALVNMCDCATGSVMGYDEIYPSLIDLVHETRLYTSKASESDVATGPCAGGIAGIKKLLNQIHVQMGIEGFDETHIHHEGEFVTVHRVHPITRKGYFLAAHTAFPGGSSANGSALSPVHLTGTRAKHIGSWVLEVDVSSAVKSDVLSDKTHLRGLPSQVSELEIPTLDTTPEETIITLPEHFPPGSITLFETSIPTAEHADGLDRFVTSGAREAFAGLSLVDLNVLLYRCDAEERDLSGGEDGAYTIPNHGTLVYAGLQGWWSVLQTVIDENDLGHPICNHLRDGEWALDYTSTRLEKHQKRSGSNSLTEPIQWLVSRFNAIRQIPSFLLPRYFALVVQTAYNAAWSRSMQLLSPQIRQGNRFLQQLAMISIQQTGFVSSASLYPSISLPCLAAGLPHFSTSWGRCWGRDIFISLRGLYLGTGRFQDAREHILAFASVLKHGMIPNLLNSGKEPRYNSRDSVWFFLQTIQDYVQLAPDGMSILKEKVPRRFLAYDDTYFAVDDSRAYSQESTIEDVIQEVLQRHATGLDFRESNAGPNLDMQMSDEGFNIKIDVDWETGLVFGGNQHNCGTWMDKMGESEQAGSKGVPGTPRDGAAIEITGLLYSVLRWLTDLGKKGNFSYTSVDSSKGPVTFQEWSARINDNFERCYYVPKEPSDDCNFAVDSKIINRRGIYKDLFRSGKPFEDYQFRPNFAIAMAVAPQLFTPDRAIGCIQLADKVLRGPTGMATLDPSDLNYRPNYNNSEDSGDFATSKGRNYHQGPEWLWPTGFFLRSMLRFILVDRPGREARVEAFQHITQRLAGCKSAIDDSPWAGLTELTNKNGSLCADSSPTQAWSAGCLIDLFMDAMELGI